MYSLPPLEKAKEQGRDNRFQTNSRLGQSKQLLKRNAEAQERERGVGFDAANMEMETEHRVKGKKKQC